MFDTNFQADGQFALAREKTAQANKKSNKRSQYKQQVRHFLSTRSRDVPSQKHGELSDTDEEVKPEMWRLFSHM